MNEINHYADVAAFNTACGCYRVEKFGDPLPPDVLALRRKLVTEEWNELQAAIKANDRVEIADACADLAYVALGWSWAGQYDVVWCVLGKGDHFRQDVKGLIEKDYESTMMSDGYYADMLASSAYTLGHVYGLPMDAVWREVQRSNMAKVVNGKVSRREDGKIIKPEGWTPPDIRGVLEREGAL